MTTTGQPAGPTLPATFCTRCGHQSGAGAFCAHCGTRLEFVDVPGADDVTLDLTRDRTLDLTGARPAWHAVPPQPEPPLVEAFVQPLDEPGPDADVGRWTRLPRRRRAAVLGAVVLLAVALVASVIAGTSWLRDRDVRSALSTGEQQYREVLASAEAAQDARAVAGVADRAKAVAAVVDSRAAALVSRRDAYGRAARAHLQAASQVLAALSGLSAAASAPLDTWSTAQPRLTQALTAEAGARADLAREDADTVAALPEGDAVLGAVTAALAPDLAGDAAARSRQLLADLQAATRTQQLRELAGPAAASRPAVTAAADTLRDGEEKTALTGLAQALAGIAGLAEVSGDNGAAWQDSRGEIAAGFSAVASGSGDAGVQPALDAALAAGDRVVTAATAAIEDWKARSASAVKARDADATALRSYADAFRTAMAQYAQLRQDLADFTARVQDPNSIVTAMDGFSYMRQAAADRREIRDELNAATVPPDLRAAHADVVAVVDRATRAVESGYEGLAQWWYCDSCAYDETPGWSTFQSESDAITKAFAAATERWESARAAAEASVTNRELPAKPEV